MTIPTSEDLALPILQSLSTRDTGMTAEWVEEFGKNLTPQERQQMAGEKSSQTALQNRILFAVGAGYLGSAKLVAIVRKMNGCNVYQITERGRQFLQDPPDKITQQILRNRYPDFAEERNNPAKAAHNGASQRSKTGRRKVQPEPSGEHRAGMSETSEPKYGIEDIIDEGCFQPRETLQAALRMLKSQKNLILQGPPGTGKTWLAQRLGYAAMGDEARERINIVQFHPSLSYEDFVRGLRPHDGAFSLVDGPFIRCAEAARRCPKDTFILILEEINRGQPAQIFGDLLMLIEEDKRTADSAIILANSRQDEEPFFVPPNLFLIGTMNLADRTLALIDVALRRRFAFIQLNPQLSKAWRDWCEKVGMPPDLLREIEKKWHALNEAISDDQSLGNSFQIGHSFITPPLKGVRDWPNWFQDIIEFQIKPLLEDYWFDNRSAVDREMKRLRGS